MDQFNGANCANQVCCACAVDRGVVNGVGVSVIKIRERLSGTPDVVEASSDSNAN